MPWRRATRERHESIVTARFQPSVSTIHGDLSQISRRNQCGKLLLTIAHHRRNLETNSTPNLFTNLTALNQDTA
jgi:hypothetical protein